MPSLVPSVVPPGSMRGRPQPTIASSGLVLRPWLTDDVPALVAAYDDPGIRR